MKVIDISHHNGVINWTKLKTEVDKVFIKSTQGKDFLDSKFFKNAIAAKKSGIEAGYYHFATLNSHDIEIDAKTEANWFVAQVSKAPIPSLPLVLDIEENKRNINRNDVELYITTFFRQLVLNGFHDYMLYSYTSFLNDNLPANHNLGNIKLWIADYNEPHFTPIGWQKISLLQYTDKGKVEGIKGFVDLNRYI